MIGFNGVEKANRCGTIGYWLAESHPGRGLIEWLYDDYVDNTMNSVFRTEWKEQLYGE